MTNFNNAVPKFRTWFPSHHVDEQPHPNTTATSSGSLNHHQMEEPAVPNFRLKFVHHDHAAAPVRTRRPTDGCPG